MHANGFNFLTAGMCLLDTTDGALMMSLYTSTSLARDTIAILYYSIVLTTITVLVAITIGTIQLLSLIAHLKPGTEFAESIDKIGEHYDVLGGAICGAFVVLGLLSVLAHKPWRRWVEGDVEAEDREEGGGELGVMRRMDEDRARVTGDEKAIGQTEAKPMI